MRLTIKGWWLAVFLGLSTGCPHLRDPWPCPSVTLQPRSPVSGTVHWSLGEESGSQTYPDDTPVPLHNNAAVAGWIGNTFWVDPDTQSVVLNDWIGVSGKAAANRLLVDFHLGDPRDWVVGTHPIDRPFQDRLGTSWEVRLQFADTACERCSFCVAFANGVEFEVLEATGSIAPYPEVVGSDFHRRYRVRLDVGDVVGLRYEEGRPVECAPRASIMLDLVFERTSSDFVIEPDRICHPEGVSAP